MPFLAGLFSREGVCSPVERDVRPGRFKLLPTFGGRVVTLSDRLVLDGNKMTMELQKTQVLVPHRA